MTEPATPDPNLERLEGTFAACKDALPKGPGTPMIDGRFSADAFESRGWGTPAAKELALQLEAEVLTEMEKLVWEEFQAVVAQLNALGHCLTAGTNQPPGSFFAKDYPGRATPGEGPRKLLLTCDALTGAAYPTSISTDALWAVLKRAWPPRS